MLLVTSTGMMDGMAFPSKTVVEQAWKSALKNGSSHSANALLLPHLIMRAEREKREYILQAMPGAGYFFQVKA